MTLYDFNILELNEQLTIVWNEGEFIDNHFSIKERCNLYSVKMFWMEIVYDAVHNSITELRSFKYSHSLDKYSPEI